jgi:hypothetical protein
MTARLSHTETDRLDCAACLVADAAVRWRCTGTLDMYDRWGSAIASKQRITGNNKLILEALLVHASARQTNHETRYIVVGGSPNSCSFS